MNKRIVGIVVGLNALLFLLAGAVGSLYILYSVEQEDGGWRALILYTIGTLTIAGFCISTVAGLVTAWVWTKRNTSQRSAVIGAGSVAIGVVSAIVIFGLVWLMGTMSVMRG